MKKGVYSAEEAAGVLGVSRRRLADLISKGRLTAKEEAGAVVIRRKDLAEFIYSEVWRAFREIIDFVGNDMPNLKEYFSLCEEFDPFAFNKALLDIQQNSMQAEAMEGEDYSNVRAAVYELCFIKNCVVDQCEEIAEEIKERGNLFRLAAKREDGRKRAAAVKGAEALLKGFAAELDGLNLPTE